MLPDPIPQWLDQARKGKAGSKAAIMAALPGNEQLRLQYMGRLGTNEFLLRLAKDSGTETPAEFSSELGLTTREGEVLSWLSKGKTNRDIAQILGLSPAHRRQASRADLLETRRREPHRGGGDRGECEEPEGVTVVQASPPRAGDGRRVFQSSESLRAALPDAPHSGARRNGHVTSLSSTPISATSTVPVTDSVM